MHLTGRSFNQIFEEPLVVLAFVAYAAILLLRLVFHTLHRLAGLVSVQILSVDLLLRSAFVLQLRVQLTRGEDGTLARQQFLSLALQLSRELLLASRRVEHFLLLLLALLIQSLSIGLRGARQIVVQVRIGTRSCQASTEVARLLSFRVLTAPVVV